MAVVVRCVLSHDLCTEVALELDSDTRLELVEDALWEAAVLEQKVTIGAARALHAKVEVTGSCAPGEDGHFYLGVALVALAEFLSFRHQGEDMALFTGQVLWGQLFTDNGHGLLLGHPLHARFHGHPFHARFHGHPFHAFKYGHLFHALLYGHSLHHLNPAVKFLIY